MSNRLKKTLILLVIIVFAGLTGACHATAADSLKQDESTTNGGLTNAKINEYQGKLLDVAMDVATKMPADPFVKVRSKSQYQVVDACFKLDQPQRALRYIDRIENWRKGEAYGDYALYCLQHNCTDKIDYYLERADIEAEKAEDWRRDRIRVKIARVHTLRGQEAQARQYTTDLVDSEQGKLQATVSQQAQDSPEAFNQQMQQIDELIAIGNYDITKNALLSTVYLFKQFYADPQKRNTIEEKIKSGWDKIPYFIRIELLMQMAEIALEHDDRQQALRRVGEARQFLDGPQWRTRYKLPLLARVAIVRFNAGDQSNALQDIDDGLKCFEQDVNQIVNINRAATIRPLAEAYQVMGRTDKAIEVYKLAVEHGVVNPNARPRAEDLSATCASMAVFGVEPDTELWQRIHQINQQLGHPW